MNYWDKDLESVYNELETSSLGLSSQKVEEGQRKFGKNTISRKGDNSALKILLSQFTNPLILLLLIIVFVSFYTGDHVDAVIILSMLGINAVLGFTQEFKAKKSLEKLRKLIKIQSKIVRDGKVLLINSEEIVPGDLVILNKGDYVPADIRLIESNYLAVNESALTGESIDVEKSIEKKNEGVQPQDINNGIFQGTFISQGSAKGIVVATGRSTFLGQSVDIGEDSNVKTNFVKKLDQFTKVLFIFVIVITSTSIIINVSQGRDIFSSFILGVTLALGITPETMPIILSISLSNAAYQLSKKKLLIKRLNVFEDLGNIDVICSDKTGTITTGILNPEHFFDINFKDSDEVKDLSLVCNAYNPNVDFKIMTNTIDEIIFKYLSKFKCNNFDSLIKVWDFDFDTRMMGIHAKWGSDEKLIIKGAHESIISKTDLSKEDKAEILRKLKNYENLGYRIIGIAKKENIKEVHSFENLKDMQLVGFVLLIDHPRKNMHKDFADLEHLNINLKIISGDSLEVTKEVCHKVGLKIVDNRIFTGDELEDILKESKEEYEKIVNKYNVFVRVSPHQKYSIIETVKNAGHVVGYVGDGINDVGALKVADVGISVENGVDVAKDCSDIIILDRSLSTIIQGVIEGRKVFNNTMKFIFSTMSSSFGNVITITFASIFLKFLPMLPVQVLLLDSLTDFQHLAISTDNVDPEMLDKPKNWDMKLFVKFSIFWGILSTMFDVFHIIVINMVTNSPELFRTTWMIESVLTELMATISIRTPRVFFKSRPSQLLLLFSLIPVIGIFLLSYSQFGHQYLGMQSPALYLPFVVVVIVGIYFVTLEILKRRYFEKFWGIKYK